jgi:hypothetical protein
MVAAMFGLRMQTQEKLLLAQGFQGLGNKYSYPMGHLG